MRYILLIPAALTLVSAGVTPQAALAKEGTPQLSSGTQSPVTEVLSQVHPFYRRKRWEETIKCPGNSKLALHGECWLKVDVEVEQCTEAPPESEEESETQDRGTCPPRKRTFRFGFV